MTDPLRAIWRTQPGKQTEFEFEFITKVLLRDTPHQVSAGPGAEAQPGALIVYSCDRPKLGGDLTDFLESVPERILLHLSNEGLNHRTGYYRRSRAVLRSYYDPNIRDPHVLTVPLGFKSGFLNEKAVDFDKPRSLVWSFAGQMKSHRREMEAGLRGLLPHHLHATGSWDAKDGISVQRLRDIYSDTVFAPCPFGNIHPDSFRVMETLEHGCIPVTIRFLGSDYFRYVFGNHPFLVCKDWDEAAVTIRNLLAAPEQLRRKQEMVRDWYAGFKADLARDIRTALDGSPDRVTSPQFAFQREGRRDLSLRLRYRLHFWVVPLMKRTALRVKRALHS